MAKIVFMGTPDFAEKSLRALVENNHEILAVVTNIDKPKGRGMKLVASPVKSYAIENNLKVLQPLKIRNNEEFINEIKAMNPEYICVVAYGKILPKELLNIPTKGAINVHGSLLPKYRGAAPIQWAVLNGDTETGITTMFMDEGMDTGDMLLKEKVSIGENETTGELWDRLGDVGANLLVKTIAGLEEGKIERVKQTGEATLAPMLNKEMALINWKEQNTRNINNLIRGLNPIIGAYTILNGKKIKIWRSEICNEVIENANKFNAGDIISADEKKGLFIKTIDGVLSVKELQAENAKKMNVQDFLRGNKLL